MLAAATVSSSQKDEKTSSSSLLFDQIYAIAKNAKNDKDTIKKLSFILTPDTCIEVRDTRLLTPAARLAKEGNKEAVNLLISLGANLNYIARGAALGGHRDYAEDLRLNHGANVNHIARGSAQGGHRDYAEHLRLNHGAYVNSIAYGAALGGHRDYAEHLRLHHGANVNHIARGAAQSSQRDYTEDLRLNHGANVHDIAWGAAQGGHRDYAEHLRLKHGADVNSIARGAAVGDQRDYAEYLRLNHGANVNDIAMGAAIGGHRDYAEYLRLNHGAHVNHIAAGAALGGHRDYAEHLRLNHGAKVNDIARGAAQWSHRDYAEHLCLNHGAKVNVIARNAADSRDFANPRIALHSLCFMKNDNYRTQIAQELQDQKLVPYDVTKLVPKAECIVKLRPKYNYSQCIALGNQEIQTWYLQCVTLIGNGKLLLPFFLSISTYLSPLTFKEARDLYDKSRFDIYQKLLVKGIDYYCKQTRKYYFFNRDEKAEKFSVTCSETKCSDQLKRLLVAESDRIKGDEKSQQNNKPNPYKNLITKHLKRFR